MKALLPKTLFSLAFALSLATPALAQQGSAAAGSAGTAAVGGNSASTLGAGAVSDEIAVDIGGGKTIVATVTHESGEKLEFKVGDKAQALIKASHVILAVD